MSYAPHYTNTPDAGILSFPTRNYQDPILFCLIPFVWYEADLLLQPSVEPEKKKSIIQDVR